MTLCSNSNCDKNQQCGRTRREYFGSILQVLKIFNPNIDNCFIKRRITK